MILEIDGVDLNIEVAGPETAPPVLLWHGANCTLRMWDFVVERLSDRFRLIRFDVRGVGESLVTDEEEAEFSLERYAEDACGILDHFKIDEVNVWSMAWGSRAAIAFCGLYPDRVRSALFNDASIGSADVRAQLDGLRKARAKQREAGVKRSPLPEGWNSHRNPDTARKAFAVAGAFDFSTVMDRLTMPILVATGDHDPNLESSRRIVEMTSHSKLVVIEDLGHGTVLQRPDVCSGIFVDFQESLAG